MPSFPQVYCVSSSLPSCVPTIFRSKRSHSHQSQQRAPKWFYGVYVPFNAACWRFKWRFTFVLLLLFFYDATKVKCPSKTRLRPVKGKTNREAQTLLWRHITIETLQQRGRRCCCRGSLGDSWLCVKVCRTVVGPRNSLSGLTGVSLS